MRHYDTTKKMITPTIERVCLVTGGTDGIGRATALRLAQAGNRVFICGRDQRRAQEVLALLNNANPQSNHIFIQADLSLMADTNRVADSVWQMTERLDAIVFSAGNFSLVPEWTSEGFERSFALNYLSRYLLSRRLLPLVDTSPSGSIVYVANPGVYRDTLDFSDLQYRNGKSGVNVAARAQFANDLLTLELARQLSNTNTRVSCVWPGIVNTNVFNNGTGVPLMLRVGLKLFQTVFGRSPESAAFAPFSLAQRFQKNQSTIFFKPNLQAKEIAAGRLSLERSNQLWSATEVMLEKYFSQHAPARPT